MRQRRPSPRRRKPRASTQDIVGNSAGTPRIRPKWRPYYDQLLRLRAQLLNRQVGQSLRVDLERGRPFTALMRHVLALAFLLALACSGCLWGRGKDDSKADSAPFSNPVAVDTGLVGKVARVNPIARFAVMNFPVGHLPFIEQRLGVYRQGQKVGEIRVTGPQLDDNIVGDIVAGEAQVGDQVRDR